MANINFKKIGFLILQVITLFIHLIFYLIIFIIELIGKLFVYINNQIIDFGNYCDDKSNGAIDETLNYFKNIIKKWKK